MRIVAFFVVNFFVASCASMYYSIEEPRVTNTTVEVVDEVGLNNNSATISLCEFLLFVAY